ncbi:zinc finger, CCHC-type containing protein [Tanacetum coccineum]
MKIVVVIFYVIEPNDSISINSIIESRDTIFDENRFSSIPRLKDIIPNLDESQRDDYSNDVPSETLEPHREAIDDEIGSIMENNTWVLSDLPPGCKPLGCKWIFKRKMKVDGTIDKFKARLVIQGFRQKERINYIDTYAPVARITTIRLLLALAAIHNLVIYQMDVKTAFLNGDLEEEVYMKQPKGFVMPSNEPKVCKLVKSLYGLKQAPKQWHQKFDEVVLSSGFLLNHSDKYVYRKFDDSGKGVIICLYVDDMLIFGTDQNQVDKTKKFLSSKFSMKDMGEADVILEKLKPNTGKPMDQLEYSRAIGCLMYAMTSTRPDIAYAIGRLSRFTSNPSRHHWHAITRVFKYLKELLPVLLFDQTMALYGLLVTYLAQIFKCGPVIMESLVKKKQKRAILELKRRHLKNTISCTYMPYPAMKIRRISASSAQEMRNDQFLIWRIHYNQYAVCIIVHQLKIRI